VRAWLEQNLGKMTVEYTATAVTAEMPGWKKSGPYTVLAEGENWVDLDEPEPKASTGRVWIEGDRMWVHVKVGFDEVFRRLP